MSCDRKRRRRKTRRRKKNEWRRRGGWTTMMYTHAKKRQGKEMCKEKERNEGSKKMRSSVRFAVHLVSSSVFTACLFAIIHPPSLPFSLPTSLPTSPSPPQTTRAGATGADPSLCLREGYNARAARLSKWCLWLAQRFGLTRWRIHCRWGRTDRLGGGGVR